MDIAATRMMITNNSRRDREGWMHPNNLKKQTNKKSLFSICHCLSSQPKRQGYHWEVWSIHVHKEYTSTSLNCSTALVSQACHNWWLTESPLSCWFRLFCSKILGMWWGFTNAICHSVNIDGVMVLLRGGGDTLTLNLAIKLVWPCCIQTWCGHRKHCFCIYRAPCISLTPQAPVSSKSPGETFTTWYFKVQSH